MGPENLINFHLKTGSSDKRIEGPATIRIDECWVDFKDEAIVPHIKFKVKTDAKFIFKKKILMAKITKVVDLRCSFNSTVHTNMMEGCKLKNTKFNFYNLDCRGFPRVFNKIIERLLKKQIRKKGENLIQKMVNTLADENEMFQGICENDS